MIFKKILLPIDVNDPHSWEQTIPSCLSILEKDPEAKLWVLSVVPNFGLGVVEEYFPAGWSKEVSKKTLEELERITKKHFPSDITPQLLVDKGAIYQVILDYAHKLEIDLIVMSAHNPKRKDYLLGPNVARVARHAEVSVLINR